MGKSSGNSWLSAVKRAFRSPANDAEKRSGGRREENEQEEDEKKSGKKRWLFRRHFHIETTIQHNAAKICSGEENMVRKQPKIESEQRRDSAAVAIAATKPSVLVKEHRAAVLIQTIFRGYLARRALLALQGVVKMQALIRGHNVRKRAKMTLQCVQSLVRVQALVCDQRRRLSCEATSLGSMFNQENNRRHSSSRNESKTFDNLGVNQRGLEEIQALIQKAKECSLKQSKTLAYALSQQMWALDDDRFSDNKVEEEHRKTHCQRLRKDGNLCKQMDQIKSDQYLDSMFMPKRLNFSAQSPKTPSSSKTRSISSSPCYKTDERKYLIAETPTSQAIYLHRMSVSENSCPLSRPNYMASTASAMARVRPQSTPRRRPSSPAPEQTGSAKKRLSFPINDGYTTDDQIRYKGLRAGQFGDEHSSNKPYCYGTD